MGKPMILGEECSFGDLGVSQVKLLLLVSVLDRSCGLPDLDLVVTYR